LQQAREKDAVSLDHEMRKLGDDLSRSNSRLSVARLELERLRRDAEKSAAQRETNRAAVNEKERLRAEREEALEAERQELEKLESQAAAIGEEYAATRAGLAAIEERQRGERNAMARLDQQFRETCQPPQRHRRRNGAHGRTARASAGRQHRARADGRAAGRRDRRTGDPRQRNGRSGRLHARSSARRGRRAQDAPHVRRSLPREALADRSSIWCANRRS
jgi:hypothetical protein